METPYDNTNADGSAAVPSLLYKYGSWRNKYHKRLITHREIFFSSARHFNDPFDSTIRLRYDLLSPEQDCELLKRAIPLLYPDAPPEEIDRLVCERLNSGRLKEANHLEWVREIQQELLYTQIGLFSVTSVPDSVLMWAYYADGHSGFCVGYDTTSLAGDLERFGETRNLLFDSKPVCYDPMYPVLNPCELDAQQFFLMRTHIKSVDWQHENERRYIVYKSTDVPIALPQATIKRVIIGCRTCDEHKREIVSLARESLGPAVILLEAKKREYDWGLQLVPLD